MELRYLHTFTVIADSASLTAAAQRLGLTQSAVSLQLRKVEAAFGMRLVDRSHQPLRLTPAGEELLLRSRALLGEFETAVDAVHRASDEVSGTLRLAASSAPGERLVPALLAGFLREHTAARADLVVTDTVDVYSLVAEGRAAFGFVGARREDLGLVHEIVARDEVVLVGPVEGGSECEPPRPASLEDVRGLPFVAREEGSGTLAVLGRALRSKGMSVDGLDVRLVAGSASAQIAAIEAGIGYGFVSRTAAADRLAAGSLSEITVPDFRVVREIYLAYDADAVAGALRGAFLEHVRSVLRGRASEGAGAVG